MSSDQTAKNYPVDLLPPEPGELLNFIFTDILMMAPYENNVYAAAGALFLIATITGRSHNINGSGLNGYFLIVGDTGTGKDQIASGVSKIMTAVDANMPRSDGNKTSGALSFLGPGELVSSAGLIKWLNKNPCIGMVLGEIGYFIQLMGNPKAPPHIRGIERLLLQLYSKSGHGNVLDPSAYSDPEKNTGFVRQPTVSFAGDATGSSIYPYLSEANVASGFVPRCFVFDSNLPRPNINNDRLLSPSAHTINLVSSLVARCLDLGNRNQVVDIAISPDAESLFAQFERAATRAINDGSEVARHLWNRAHLKALKLAAIPAISRNMWNPVVTGSDALWACNLVNYQTVTLIAKFDRQEVGSVDGNQALQRSTVLRVVNEYMSGPWENFRKYGLSYEEMHKRRVVTQSYISRRVLSLPAFANDRYGATAALKRTIQSMLDDHELQEVPGKQMQDEFGLKPRAFMVRTVQPFIEA